MKNRKSIIFIGVFILMCTLLCGSAFAAGTAQASMSGGGTVNKGDTETVTLTYSGDTFGSADVLFTYDSSVLEYSSCNGAVAYGGSGTVKATMSDVSNSSTLSCSLSFKAIKSGSSKITATTQTLYNFNEEELTAAAASASVTVKDESKVASGNAELLSLMVSGGNLSPSFNSNVTSYTMNVPYDTTVCTIAVKTADDKAEYKITGSKELKVGKNVREVIVTAENGNTKTYSITITRAERKNESSPKPDTPKVDEKEPEVNEPESNDEPEEKEPEEPDYMEDGKLIAEVGDKTYYIVENFTKEDIPASFKQDVNQYYEKDIPVIVSEDGKLVLAMLQNKDDEKTGWYFFNDKKDTFSSKKTLSADEIIKYESALKQVEKADTADVEEKPEVDSVDVLMIALGSTVALLLIVLIALVARKRK